MHLLVFEKRRKQEAGRFAPYSQQWTNSPLQASLHGEFVHCWLHG